MPDYKFTKRLSPVGIFCFLVLFIFCLQACKKEYTPYPYHNIEQFEVKTDETNRIDGVIKGDSIILYWPPFVDMPDSIRPNIIVSERAKIQPASGVKVAFSDQTAYTVTAQDGSSKRYFLKRVNNQPMFDFELSRVMNRGGLFLLAGNYFVDDQTKTSVYLIDKNKKETRITPVITLTKVLFHAQVPLASVIDTGSYQIKMISGSRTRIKGPYKIMR